MIKEDYSISAAELMDGIYCRQRFIYDATRRYYLLGRDRLIADLQVPEGGSVLEIGCGTARNLIQAARRYPSACLYGLDVSEAMLETARGSIASSGMAARIKVAKGDATAFDPTPLFGPASFDRVFISYVLSMIPQWQDAVKSAAAYVAPGGALLIVDFGDFRRYPAPIRWAQLSWLSRFSVSPIPAFEHKIAALADQVGFMATTMRLYGGYAIEAKLRNEGWGVDLPRF